MTEDIASTHIDLNEKGKRICVDNEEPNPNYIAHWEPQLAIMSREFAQKTLDIMGNPAGHSNHQWLHDRLLLVIAGVAPIDTCIPTTVNTLCGIFSCTRAPDGIGTVVSCNVPFDLLWDSLQEAFNAICNCVLANSANVPRGTPTIDNLSH